MLKMVQTCQGSIAPPLPTLLALSMYMPALGDPLNQMGAPLSKWIAHRLVELREQAWRPWSMDLCMILRAGTCFSLHECLLLAAPPFLTAAWRITGDMGGVIREMFSLLSLL